MDAPPWSVEDLFLLRILAGLGRWAMPVLEVVADSISAKHCIMAVIMVLSSSSWCWIWVVSSRGCCWRFLVTALAFLVGVWSGETLLRQLPLS
jgi:hypothetical protein